MVIASIGYNWNIGETTIQTFNFVVFGLFKKFSLRLKFIQIILNMPLKAYFKLIILKKDTTEF